MALYSKCTFKFRCTICQCIVSCEHQGEKDVRRHLDSKKHKKMAADLDTQQRIKKFFKSNSSSIHDKVMRAEVKSCLLLAKHNIPIAISDHLGPHFHDIFPDSEIAKAYSCACTKTTCIINGALLNHFQMSLINYMKAEPFALAIDGSNDSGLQKLNPLTVRIYDVTRSSRVSTQLLDMCLTSSSTAESIFSKVNETLTAHGINWDLCVAFSVDNTSVNLGRKNSIKTRVHSVNPSVCFIGCPCHMVHNTAMKSAEAFQVSTNFDVEDMLVDIYYWFDKSTKRKNHLLSFCEFCDITYKQIVKHISVHWLSLECAVERTLKQYVALRSYFLSADENQARFNRLRALFECPITEIFLLFYQGVLPLYTSLNKFLQRETPCVHLVHDRLVSFVTNLLGKFVKVSVIKAAIENDCLLEVDYVSVQNQLLDSSIFIGFTTRSTLKRYVDNGDISRSDERKFYSGVRDFYVASMNYVKKTFPLNSEVLQHALLIKGARTRMRIIMISGPLIKMISRDLVTRHNGTLPTYN